MRDPVRGDRELARALRLLAKGPTGRQVDGMANRSMKPVVDDTRKRLRAHRNYASKYPAIFPKQRNISSDHVDLGIVMRKDKVDLQGRSYKVGATRRARYLLHLLEFGVRAHFQPNFLGGWMHPGHTPRPSITPAYERGKGGVIRDFGEEIAIWLEKSSHRLGMRVVRRGR